MTFDPGALDPTWHEALERLRSARRTPYYMPAMLLTVLDMLEEESLDLPFVPFEPIEPRFAGQMDRYGLDGRDKAWMPFFYLSATAGVWDLFLGDRPADFSDLKPEADHPQPRPKGRAGLVRRADRARLRDGLMGQLETLQGRNVLRAHLVAMLQADGGED